MKMKWTSQIAAFFFLVLAASCPATSAETITGRIVGVHDGDTVTLLVSGNTEVKIRLAQIDAPELGQDFGKRSKQSLSELIYGKEARVEKETTDRYGRTVGTIFVGGINANMEQVRRGMAWPYRKYLRNQSLLKIEELAKEKRLGLWSMPNPVPPWDFRHGGGGAGGVKMDAALSSMSRAKPKTDGLCGMKHTCKEMSSCSEAMFYLKECGLSKLDRDGNGVPCESLCGVK